MADRLAQKPSRNAGRGRVVPPLAAILIVFGASFAAACSDGQYSQTSGQDGTSRNSGITTLATLATSDTTIFESMPQIEGGLLLADRRIVVALGGVQQVLIFDTTGHLLRTIGRVGAGPGEFRRIKGPWSAASGAELVLFDRSLRRFTRLDTAGRLLGEVTYTPQPGDEIGAVFANAVGVLDNGLLVASFTRANVTTLGSRRDSVQISTMDSEGAVTPVGRPLPGDELFVAPGGRAGVVALRQSPFGRRLLVSVCGSSVIYADNGAFELTRFDMRDSTRTVLRSTVVDVPIQRQHYVAEIGRLLDNPAAATDAAIAAFQEITTQTTLPVLQAIRCTGDGEVWVDRFAEPGSSTRSVLLFDRKNNLVGSMQLPTEYRLLDATRDRMLIARPNEDAIPIIEVIAVRLNN